MQNQSFLGALFDFSFTDFITTRMISFIYKLQVGLGAIVAIILVIGTLSEAGFFAAILAGFFAGIGFLLWCLVCRLGLEFTASIFRAVEILRELRDEARVRAMGDVR